MRLQPIIAIATTAILTGCSCASEHTVAAIEPLDLIAARSDSAAIHRVCQNSMPDNGCVRLRVGRVGYLGRTFNDSNYIHLQAAMALGIDPIEKVSQAWNTKRPVVHIASCRDFYVDSLTHSLPYLVPEAATLLHDIGRSFRDTLRARGGGDYRVKVTSVLRTRAAVARLRRRNRNAVDTSAHQFGTTFDISYLKFICDSATTVARTQEDLKNLLGEILLAYRDSGRCYVKYERRQSCFHITARR